ncbi:MAG: hypothetical protein QOH12_3041 [Solirubrobacteraceae bacterium]|jgi:hypothetical protein|nr:hypothetical protein [Solirubrobacteraceae bacterium]
MGAEQRVLAADLEWRQDRDHSPDDDLQLVPPGTGARQWPLKLAIEALNIVDTDESQDLPTVGLAGEASLHEPLGVDRGLRTQGRPSQ